jgi:hypothetical protein
MSRGSDSAPDMEARQDADCRLSDSGRLKEVVLGTDGTVERLGNVGES